MSLGQRIATGVKASLAARVINAGSNALLLLLLTRYLLEPDEYGTLYFAIAVLAVGELFATLGLVKSNARYVTEYLEKDPSQVRYVISRSLGMILVGGIVVSIVVGLASGWLAEVLNRPEAAALLLVGSFYVAGRAVTQYLKLCFQAFNRVAWSAVVSSINAVARLGFAVALVLLGFDAVGAMAGYVLGYLVAGAIGIGLLYVKFYRDLPPLEEPEPGLLRRLIEYSVPTAATRASVIVDSRVDTILVGMLSTPAAIAFYTLGRQVSDLCIVPAQSVGFTISPTLGEQSAAENEETAARVYRTALENVLLLYVPAAAGLAIVAEPTVRYVFGADYLGAVPVLQLFSVFIVVRAVHKITGSGLDYLGLARIRAIARATSASGNFLLNLLLIPQFGAAGAALATVVTYSTYTMVNVFYIVRELPIDLDGLATSVVRIFGIAAVMSVVVVAANGYVQDVPTLAATVALGGAVWAVLSIATGLVRPREVWAFLS